MDKTTKLFLLSLLVPGLAITIILDLHFRLVLVISTLSLVYTAFKHLNGLHQSQSHIHIVESQEVIIAQSQEDAINTVAKLDTLHSMTADAERDANMTKAERQVNRIQRGMDKERELQQMRHAVEYATLEEHESQANSEARAQSEKTLGAVLEDCNLKRQEAQTRSQAILSNVRARHETKRRAEEQRVQNARYQSDTDLNDALKSIGK